MVMKGNVHISIWAYDNLTKVYCCARWLTRADLPNRNTRVPTEVQVKSGQFLQELGGPGACSLGKKIINLMSSNCWKGTKIVNPTITTLFCIILNLYDPTRCTFLAPGEEEMRAHPAHLLCLLS